jgi:restriction system protein
MIVQCKRNATENKVSRPVIQQFKGVVEEQKAFRRYVVTTSGFTVEAVESAGLSDKIVLVDMDSLVHLYRSNVPADIPCFRQS